MAVGTPTLVGINSLNDLVVALYEILQSTLYVEGINPRSKCIRLPRTTCVATTSPKALKQKVPLLKYCCSISSTLFGRLNLRYRILKRRMLPRAKLVKAALT